MHLLNRFFGPFAAVLVATAVFYSNPDPFNVWACVGIIVVAVASNAWIARNVYRYILWTRYMRHAQIWANYVWALALFCLLGKYWGPSWLLLIVAPVSAAVQGGRNETLLAAAVSGGSLLAVYKFWGVEGGYAWGQAFDHAIFLCALPLFIHSLAQSSMRVRQ